MRHIAPQASTAGTHSPRNGHNAFKHNSYGGSAALAEVRMFIFV